MDILKKTAFAVLGLAFGALVVLAFVHSGTTQPAPQQQAFGSVASPELPYDHICVNGVCTYSARVAMAATSSVPCSIPFPNVGTTSVESAGVLITANGLVNSQLINLSTSTTPIGSSSPALIFAHSVAAGATDFVYWAGPATTTNATNIGVSGASGESQVFGTSSTEYLNMRIATATPGTFATYYTGVCTAKFRQLQ